MLQIQIYEYTYLCVHIYACIPIHTHTYTTLTSYSANTIEYPAFVDASALISVVCAERHLWVI